MDRHHDLEAAHVGLQDLGDGDTAIGLQMVLEECDEHTRRSHAGVVQSVGQIGLAILALDTDVQTAGLCIAQVGAGADFEVFLLAGLHASMSQLLTFRSARSPEQQFS